MTSRIDTLATHRAFKQAGIEPAHAEVIVEAINRADDRLATRDDLAFLRSELSGEIEAVRTKLGADIEVKVVAARSDLGGQISALRAEMNDKFSALGERIGVLEGEIGALRSQGATMKWVMGINVAMTVGIFIRLFGVS
jgi:hypothetical protein